MILNRQNILKEIDDTLDQLLHNANVLQQIANNPKYIEEKNALENTQESLFSHLIHMDCLLSQENISIKKKERNSLNISKRLTSTGRFDSNFVKKMYRNFMKPISTDLRTINHMEKSTVKQKSKVLVHR
ncbi:MAG: hypothetical protein ACRCSV_04245 [Chlamydiales bacterium]